MKRFWLSYFSLPSIINFLHLASLLSQINLTQQTTISPNEAITLSLLQETTITCQNYYPTIKIDNISYRETACQDRRYSHATLTIPKGKWQLNCRPIHQTTAPVVYSHESLINKYIGHHEDKIDQLKIQVPNDNSKLWISSWIQSQGFRGKTYFHIGNTTRPKPTYPTYHLYLNDKLLANVSSANFGFLNHYQVERGIYQLKTIAKSNGLNWCSCPTMGQGFQLSHGLVSWVTHDSEGPIQLKQEGPLKVKLKRNSLTMTDKLNNFGRHYFTGLVALFVRPFKTRLTDKYLMSLFNTRYLLNQ